jgi:hypothetical protein
MLRDALKPLKIPPAPPVQAGFSVAALLSKPKLGR